MAEKCDVFGHISFSGRQRDRGCDFRGKGMSSMCFIFHTKCSLLIIWWPAPPPTRRPRRTANTHTQRHKCKVTLETSHCEGSHLIKKIMNIHQTLITYSERFSGSMKSPAAVFQHPGRSSIRWHHACICQWKCECEAGR